MINYICKYFSLLIILGACLDLAGCATTKPPCVIEDGIPFKSCVIMPKTTKQLREEAEYAKLKARVEIALATTCYPWSSGSLDTLGGEWMGVKS